jgi:hypothetical protein
VPKRDIERLAGRKLHRDKRVRSREARLEQSHERAIRRRTVTERLERGGQPPRVFGNDVELERLDRDQTIALIVVGTENRSENAAANLMQDAIRTEALWCGRPR